MKQRILLIVLAFLPITVFSSKAISYSDYMSRLYRGSLYVRGDCSVNLRPDRFYIDGGVAGEGAKTTAAKQALQTKTAGLQRLAKRFGGRLEKKELVRTIRNAGGYRQPVPGNNLSPTYIIVQRFRLDFPTKADIDQVLEGVMSLKIDYLGSNFRIGYPSSAPQILAFYRFSNLRQRLGSALKSCRSAAYKNWCTTNAAPSQQVQCMKTLRGMDGEFITRSLYLKSQPVLNQRGSSYPISISYPWNDAKLERFVLMSDVPVKLQGKISMQRNYRRY